MALSSHRYRYRDILTSKYRTDVENTDENTEWVPTWFTDNEQLGVGLSLVCRFYILFLHYYYYYLFFIIYLFIYFFWPTSTKPVGVNMKLSNVRMVATTSHSEVSVCWKETAFPLWRAMDRRWNKNVVSLVSYYYYYYYNIYSAHKFKQAWVRGAGTFY